MSESKTPIALTNADIENGLLIAALGAFGELAKGLKQKYDLARMHKAAAKTLKEVGEERADLIRLTFPKKTRKDAEGNEVTDHFVEAESLDTEKRKIWEMAIKDWREKSFPWPSQEPYKLDLEKSAIRRPGMFQLIEASMSVIEINEVEDSKATATEQLEDLAKKIEEVRKELKKNA